MRVVLGLSLTATSAVWVLVDTYDGKIIADEVVPLESLNEIARATARSVQTFALQSEQDIDGVRLVWDGTDSSARHQGIRLRTKLRLFGFDTVETVSEEAAREGRNRTARHIAPHLVLAYGAARANLDESDTRGALRRLVSRVPLRVPTAVPARLMAAAASVAGIAVLGIGLYAVVGGSPSHDVAETTVAEAVVPVAPAPPAPQSAGPIAPAAPQAVAVLEPAGTAALPEVAPTMPEYASVPTVVTDAETAVPLLTPSAELIDAPDAAANLSVDPAAPQELAASTGVPHLSGTGPALPVAVPAQAAPAAVAPAPPAPGGPLGALFRALP
jgi:hypothetical protein